MSRMSRCVTFTCHEVCFRLQSFSPELAGTRRHVADTCCMEAREHRVSSMSPSTARLRRGEVTATSSSSTFPSPATSTFGVLRGSTLEASATSTLAGRVTSASPCSGTRPSGVREMSASEGCGTSTSGGPGSSASAY